MLSGSTVIRDSGNFKLYGCGRFDLVATKISCLFCLYKMQLLIHLLSLALTLSVAATDAKICEVIHNKLTLLRYSNSTKIAIR